MTRVARAPLAVLRGIVAWPEGLFVLVTDEDRARLIPIAQKW